MSARRDSRTEDEIRKKIHEMNSTQMNCDVETLVGTRIRTSSQVSEEDSQIEQDVAEDMWENELRELLDKVDIVLERKESPDFSLASLWFMTCVVAYLYGVTLGLYMCSK